MKKVSLTILAMLGIAQFSYAQWTTAGNNIYNSNTGNVGIGINSGTAKFAVYQSTALGSVAKNNLLLSSVGGSAANSVQNNIWLVRNAAGSDFTTSRLHDGISIDGSYVSPQTDTRTWWERDPTSDVQSWGTAASTYLTIKQGKMGIGTVSPSEKLSVAGGNLLMDNAAWYSAKNTAGSTVSLLGLASDNNIYIGDLFGGIPANSLIIRTNGLNKMTINANGNVGIGVTTPQNKLDVNGRIHSQSVLIDMLGWSDYVFKKDYQLRPLSEVKDYIDQNQHLPEIPSEQQIAKEGLNLGEMNKLLMKKVEELTLYMIEQNKRIEDQQKDINDLKIQLKNK
ncbi:hypothetical protein AB6735_27385 [Mucilaginibacter sp. RCC_168]|uniref:hypothetical protein n=1 Tax=Mucilaginibacter sp. RCC_168 TaxID=3239221 RepID=UPI003523CCDA